MSFSRAASCALIGILSCLPASAVAEPAGPDLPTGEERRLELRALAKRTAGVIEPLVTALLDQYDQRSTDEAGLRLLVSKLTGKDRSPLTAYRTYMTAAGKDWSRIFGRSVLAVDPAHREISRLQKVLLDVVFDQDKPEAERLLAIRGFGTLIDAGHPLDNATLMRMVGRITPERLDTALVAVLGRNGAVYFDTPVETGSRDEKARPHNSKAHR